MENHSKYTPTQESWIEGNYNDFFAAVREGQFSEAETTIEEVRVREFEAVANDMSRILANKKLHWVEEFCETNDYDPRDYQDEHYP